jgi:hypothetical protein
VEHLLNGQQWRVFPQVERESQRAGRQERENLGNSRMAHYHEVGNNNAEPLPNVSLPEYEEIRREYLLGRIITDMSEGIIPTISKSSLQDLHGKNSSQLWEMITFAKKEEYGDTEISIDMMRFLIDTFDEDVKQEVSNVVRPTATYNYSVYPSSASSPVGGGGARATPAETPRSTSLKTRVLDVLIHYFPGDAADFRLMPLDVLNGHLANLIQNLTVRSPELETLYKSVRAYLKSKKNTKNTIVSLQSKLQYVLPHFANGNRQRFASMTLPELQAELRTLMTNTQNAAKKEEIRQALQQGKGSRVVPVRQVSKPGTRWTMTKARKGRKTRRSKHRK